MTSRWRHPRTQAVLAVSVGALVGLALVCTSFFVFGPNSTVYWQSQVNVPAGATQAHPWVEAFQGATFTIWWAPQPAGPSTGVSGLTVNISEPSGVTIHTGTGCAECDSAFHTWFSADGSTGIGWYDLAFGDVTLYVRA